MSMLCIHNRTSKARRVGQKRTVISAIWSSAPEKYGHEGGSNKLYNISLLGEISAVW